ncbi:Protein of unknown function, partial [Gryllus bimaculatus]
CPDAGVVRSAGVVGGAAGDAARGAAASVGRLQLRGVGRRALLQHGRGARGAHRHGLPGPQDLQRPVRRRPLADGQLHLPAPQAAHLAHLLRQQRAGAGVAGARVGGRRGAAAGAGPAPRVARRGAGPALRAARRRRV